MLVAIIASALLAQQPGDAIQQFRGIRAVDVPVAVFANSGELCDFEDAAECRRRFLEKGAAWRGDVDGDGVLELLLQGAVLGGTGGNPYYLFQARRGSWEPLNSEGGWLTLTGSPRFDILPTARGGYHDIRVSAVECFKWNGKEYVPYAAADYRALSPRWFDGSKLDEAELFWAIRYRGAPAVTFEPQWFSAVPQWGSNVEVEDATLKLKWVAMFKAGVYGVQGGRSFLLLPRPAYSGAERLELDGDWLVIYATVLTSTEPAKSELRPVARYNRRTKDLRVLDGEK